MSYGYLQHHGILGMKWGVRRYQKEDGTRTPAGLKQEEKYRKYGIKKRTKKYTKDYVKAQKQVGKDLANAINEDRRANYYANKKRRATMLGKTKKAEKMASMEKEYRDKSNQYVKDLKISNAALKKTESIIKKDKDVILTFSKWRDVNGHAKNPTVDGGVFTARTSRGKVVKNSEKNQTKYQDKMVGDGYRFVTTYYYFY